MSSAETTRAHRFGELADSCHFGGRRGSDVLSPEVAERMLATNRYATLATIPGAGHTLNNTLRTLLGHSDARVDTLTTPLTR